MLPIGRVAAMFIEHRFAGHDQTVAEKGQQRRRRFVGDDPDGKLVNGFGLGHRRGDGCLLLRLRVADDAVHQRMDDVVGGDRRAVVEFVIFVEMEQPGGRVFHCPALRQPAFEVALRIIVGTEGTGDFTPDAVKQRNAIAVRVVGFDGFGDADRDARLGTGFQWGA